MQVYEGIYDTVAGNFSNADKKFEYEKTTFLHDVKSHPQIIDVSRYTRLPNPQFFQAFYVAVYKRLPEERETAVWEGRFGLPEEEFQKAFLKETINSSVAGINHLLFINNPYFKQHKGMKYKFFGLLYGLTDKSRLREFGKKLPAPIQKMIRKVFL